MIKEYVKAKDTASKETMQLAVCKVGGGEYAMDIMRIVEIIRPQKITKIPRSPEFIEGVINLRGKVVPIVDLRKRFGMDTGFAEQKKVRMVIVRMAGRVMGTIVDEVSEVIHIDTDRIEATPDSVRGVDAEYLKGVGKLGDRLIIVLDMNKVLSKDEMAKLKAAEEASARTSMPVPEGA